MHKIRIDGRFRGITSRAEWRQHLQLAAAIRRLSDRATVAHFARPLPEGIGGLLARGLPGGPRYICWAHGEELTAAATSREHRWLTALVCRRASLMIANSRFTADLVQGFGVPAAKIRVIHPGVDSSRFHPAIDGSAARARIAPDADCVLLTVGRLQRRKGHDRTIAAMAALRDSFPKLRYIIAGDGQERARLESLAAELGVADRVSFLGSVPDEELPQLYAACDIFVMPARRDGPDVEGFGIVYLEAAASGRPTISGQHGGGREAIDDGRTGLSVSGDDTAELTSAIARLAGSPDLRRSFGDAGRRRVLAEFDWVRAARQLEQAHEEVLAS